MPGYNHLFIPGPTNVPDSLRRAVDLPMEDMRAPDFPEFTLPLFEDLKKVFQTETGQVFLFPGSGTGGWEAAITNTLSPGDKVLASRFGQFSNLWVDLCQRHGLEVEAIDVPWGEGVPVTRYAEALAADTEHRIKAVLVCHNETATGVTSDVAAVRAALDSVGHPAMLYVDGVSSIASIDFRMDEWGVDVAVSGSQKGFMLPTGLAIVCVSQKALEARKSAKLNRCYFDFEDMIRTNASGYFPYTPATTLLRGLRASVDYLLGEGLDNVFARHHRMAEGVRQAVNAWGLKLCAATPHWYSDTVSAIYVPEGIDSAAVVRHAYYRYNLSLGAGLTKVAGKVFRIGHLGAINEVMVLSALAGTEMVLRDVGIPVEAGSGVAAAQEHFRATATGEQSIAAAAQ
ncbi:L-aspartate--glyoxylate aminotransferase BhcA [Ferruginivarius sediminum]|uniref:Aminotransferase class V-fold PLP-dependent enzyme n=1 Tax=Ferruginivarius sediminum TaxID=2661937 RepID=A0A369TF40_9PROT|nr:L-aspartate--glyoxylate aminotransferase BhcA [Ferruginivarius sediminum]RDD62737.1 aminotransferase class V-fold PLP-dependent enzyme [Ferruginivarius sediminum]